MTTQTYGTKELLTVNEHPNGVTANMTFYNYDDPEKIEFEYAKTFSHELWEAMTTNNPDLVWDWDEQTFSNFIQDIEPEDDEVGCVVKHGQEEVKLPKPLAIWLAKFVGRHWKENHQSICKPVSDGLQKFVLDRKPNKVKYGDTTIYYEDNHDVSGWREVFEKEQHDR